MLRDQNKTIPVTQVILRLWRGKASISGVDMVTEEPPGPHLSASTSPASRTATYTTRAQRSKTAMPMAHITELQNRWSGCLTHWSNLTGLRDKSEKDLVAVWSTRSPVHPGKEVFLQQQQCAWTPPHSHSSSPAVTAWGRASPGVNDLEWGPV